MTKERWNVSDTCPKCHGAKRVDCWWCSGKGKVEKTYDGETRWEDHLLCDGTGKLVCIDCGGTGFIN